ncbi:MAG: (2Fe-2S)-binding protein [Acidimicrobiaceae bacterium]|nr:(2Fe-2S)-binding protein [Acidimicrobiaceae bacterium]
MSREKLIELARGHLHHAVNKTVPLADDVAKIPVENYYDPDRWSAEMEKIFARVPLVLGFSAELKKPGDYKAMEVSGVPLILVRSKDGVVRGFVNMCSHRGAQLVDNGCGKTRSFACPYHAWTYNLSGDLIAILDDQDFGEVDMSCLGLTPLNVEERVGIIWGSITPGNELYLSEFLAGYDEYLENHDFTNCELVGRQTVEGPNWKVAYDGYLDFYHLPILHKDTFGPDYNNKSIFDNWGPHQRVQAPDHRLLELVDIPEDEWDHQKLVSGVWTIFPHISIASFDAGGHIFMVSQLFPGDDPDTSVTHQNFLATFTPTDEQKETIAQTMDFLRYVVAEEDYYTGNRIQKTVKTGAKSHFYFGRNEEGGQRFHRWTDALLAADSEEDLMLLYKKGVG